MHQSGYSTLRHILFRLDPEIAHNISICLLAAAPKLKPVRRWLTDFFDYNDSRLATSVFGLRFVNPVGVAAGYDKNAIAILRPLSCTTDVTMRLRRRRIKRWSRITSSSRERRCSG